MKNANLIIIYFLFLSTTITGRNSIKTSNNANSIRSTDTSVNSNTNVNTPESSMNGNTNVNTPESSMNGNINVNTPESSTTNEAASRTFTIDELKQYNGQDGNPSYVAINGVVYDVTNVRSWKNGTHQGLSAGMDLTNELANSPHGDIVLTNLPVVGTLIQ